MSRPPRIVRHGSRGYTFIEIIIVVVILGVVLAGVAPMYRGSMTWVRTDRAVRNIVALLKYGQERAMTDAVEYRLYLDPDRRSYWLTRLTGFDQEGEKVFAQVTEDRKTPYRLPETLEMERVTARKGDKPGVFYIGLYPHGASDEAAVRLEDRSGREVTIETKGRAGQLSVEGL